MDTNWLFIIGETLDVIGKILIAYAALRVSHRFRHERRVDAKVFAEMKLEQNLAIFGIVVLIVGYFMRLPTFF